MDHLLDYLTDNDVARIVTLGCQYFELQEKLRDLDARKTKLWISRFRLQQELAAAETARDQARQPAAKPGAPSLGLDMSLRVPGTPAGKPAKPATPALPRLPAWAKDMSLLDPAQKEQMESWQQQAMQAQVDRLGMAIENETRSMNKLQAEFDRMLVEELDSSFFQTRREKIVNAMTLKVTLHWPKLKGALKGEVNPATRMDNDIRLVANALGTLAAEVGTNFTPRDEGPSKASRGPVTGRDFGLYDEWHPNAKGRMVPGTGNGNRPYNPYWAPEFGYTAEEWFAIQDAMADGPRFKGRGFVQLTGRGNYLEAMKHLGSTFQDCDLIEHPELANDVRFTYEIFASHLKAIERGLLKALKTDDLTAARSWVNAGGPNNKSPNGLESFTGAYRATFSIFFAKIGAKALDAADEKRLLDQCEETETLKPKPVQ